MISSLTFVIFFMSDPPKQPIRHWLQIEDLYYYFFLIFKIKEVTANKKQTKIYKEMARFINSKTAVQCRTHHEKKISEFKKGKKENEKPEVESLHQFYYQKYEIRRLSEDHLKWELDLFLKKMKNGNAITQIQHEKLRDSINPILQELGFAKKIQLHKQNCQQNASQTGASEGDISQQAKLVNRARTKRKKDKTEVKEMAPQCMEQQIYEVLSMREMSIYNDFQSRQQQDSCFFEN